VGEAAERELETLRVKSPGIPPPRLGNALRYKRPRAGGSVLPGVYAVLVPDAPTVRREPQNGAPSRIISRTVANPIRAARLRKTPQIVFVFEHDAGAALVVLLPVHACILRKPLRGIPRRYTSATLLVNSLGLISPFSQRHATEKCCSGKRTKSARYPASAPP
jgi:hypothetical protein